MFKLLFLYLSIFNANAYSLIALKQQNVDILYEALMNVSNPTHSQYGQYWSAEKINNLVSPPKSDIENLLTYLKDNNTSIVLEKGETY